jgi:DNA polymerase III delta prime subunit
MTSEESWLEKYRPKTFKEYLNYNDYSGIVNEWIKPFMEDNSNISKHHNCTSKPFLILYGPPSYGKTTLAHCIFNEFDFEILECNASDTRNKSKLEKRIKTGKTSFEMKADGSGFKPYGLILDELDGLTSGDNGGVDTIMKIAFITDDKLVKNNEYKVRYPIICTTNSIKEKKILPILKFGELITMNKPSKEALFNLGKQIIKAEKIPITQKLLKEYISENDDYRLLINKLYMLYVDLKNYKGVSAKKKRVIELVERVKDEIEILKVNNSNIYEIAEDLVYNLKKYDKNQILNVIDANNLLFYFTMITNYNIGYQCPNKLLDDLIDNIVLGNKFLEVFKKNKNDNYEMVKYLNYILSYGSIVKLHDMLNNSANDVNSANSKLKVKMHYHTKYNDMKQDKSFYFNNQQFKFDISNVLTDKHNGFLSKRKIVNNKKLINSNNMIFNNIIDLDILLLYNKLGYPSTDCNISKSLISKLMKYYSK